MASKNVRDDKNKDGNVKDVNDNDKKITAYKNLLDALERFNKAIHELTLSKENLNNKAKIFKDISPSELEISLRDF